MITGSILLALALESWWGGLADGRAEAATLASLEAELAATRTEMLRARGVHQSRCAAVTELRQMVRKNADEVDPVALGLLLRDGASVTSVDAPLGVLRGLISSGSLALIRDPALRSALAAWPARLDDHREAEVFIHDVVRDQWVPWLVTNSVLTEHWGRGEPRPLSQASAHVLARTVENPEFQNLVMMQDYYCTFLLGGSTELESDIEALTALVSTNR